MSGTAGSSLPVDQTKDKNLTFLALPPDLQKPTRRPNTNIASDKDRIATSRHPELIPKNCGRFWRRHLRERRGRQVRVRRSPQRHKRWRKIRRLRRISRPAQQQTTRPQFQTNQTAQLQMPARPNNSFSKYGTGMSAGSAIQQATQAAAAHRGGAGRKAISVWEREHTGGS